MATKYCNTCNSKIIYWPLGGDIIHECRSGNATLDQEDRPMTNSYTDVDGTVKATRPQGSFYTMGRTKKNWGRRSYTEGERVYDRTPRGAREETHIQIQRRKYLETKNEVIKIGGK